MPLLGYLIKKGNTTVYEWRTGSVPQRVEKHEQFVFNFGDEEQNQEEEDKIDFGDFSVDTSQVQLETAQDIVKKEFIFILIFI